ncbi:hypothetical protein DFJ73DRAFT_820151 [Zopfochytrium polystomum]|nr:hypothetical protein DFJ73DRAFT_820151 [Zopfochytrium polystomum]
MVNQDEDMEKLYQAIRAGSAATVRDLLQRDRTLLTRRYRPPNPNHPSAPRYDPAVELDAIKFLGAYVGACTPLVLALLAGQDAIARDVVERCVGRDEVDVVFGGGNTALHLAALLGVRDVVRLLLERGACKTVKNGKGFTPVDVLDDPEMRSLFETSSS